MRTRLHQIVADMAARRPDAPALTYKDQTATYAELWELANGFAAGVGDLGLARGERIGLLLDKRIETVASVIGSSAGGGVFVPINPLLKGAQVAYIVDDCDVRVLVTTAQRYELMREDLASCASLKHVVVLPWNDADACAKILEKQGSDIAALLIGRASCRERV